MFVVPAETAGIEIMRIVATMEDRDELDGGIHGYIRYNQVRVPADAMLGGPGRASRWPRPGSAVARRRYADVLGRAEGLQA